MLALPNMNDAHLGSNRIVWWISVGLTAGMVLGWAGLLSLYVRGRLIWGHWPRGCMEDPKNVGEGFHYMLAGYSTATLGICAVGVFLVFPVLVVEHKGSRSAKTIALVTAVASILMIFIGPWVSWYMD